MSHTNPRSPSQTWHPSDRVTAKRRAVTSRKSAQPLKKSRYRLSARVFYGNGAITALCEIAPNFSRLPSRPRPGIMPDMDDTITIKDLLGCLERAARQVSGSKTHDYYTGDSVPYDAEDALIALAEEVGSLALKKGPSFGSRNLLDP